MKIHFSILAVILVVSLIWEGQIKWEKLDSIYRGEDYTYKSPLLPWLLIFGYIAFLAAMRTRANDTGVYIQSFRALEGSWEAFWAQVSTAGTAKDWGFDAVSILFKILISDGYHQWLAMYAVVESAAFIYILRRYGVSLLDCCFYLFCSTLYYNYFSMMRQWFAVVVLFGASGLIAERRFIRYLFICVVVAQFHSSAYLMIPIYFLVQGRAWSPKQTALIAVFAGAMIFLNPILGTLEASLEGTTYDYAISAMNSGSGSSMIRGIIAAVPVLLAFVYKDEIDDPMMNICVNMSLLNMMLNILAAFTSGLFIIRFATYTNVYNIILYPYLLNVSLKGSGRTMIKVLFYIIYLAFYVYQMKYQGSFSYGSDILGYFT